jgi:Uma2 family endonuclease
MNIAIKPFMTLAEFLEWEEQQEFRYEFDGFQAIAMTGGTLAHAIIQRNLAMALGVRLRGKPCQFVGNDLKIESIGRIRYPDGYVFCSSLPSRTKVVREPVVIFEVLSDSTERTDKVTKNTEYAAVPSVRRYVILSQRDATVRMFERVGNEWKESPLAADAILRMPEIGIEVPMSEFYEGVTFDPDEEAD